MPLGEACLLCTCALNELLADGWLAGCFIYQRRLRRASERPPSPTATPCMVWLLLREALALGAVGALALAPPQALWGGVRCAGRLGRLHVMTAQQSISRDRSG